LTEALKKATSVLEKCEMDYEILLKKFDLLCKTNDLKSAKSLLAERESFINSKSQTKFIVLNAQLERFLNKIPDAKTRLQNAIRLYRDDPELQSQLVLLNKMDGIKQKATDAFKEKRFDEALKLYQECFLLDQYNMLWKSVILSNQASCLMAQNKTKEARDVMKLSTECDPTNAKNFYKRGKLEKDLKDWECAEACMKKAKSMDPSLQIDAELKQISQEVVKSNNKDYYAILGLQKNATPEQIKKAYKEMVRKHHPDKHTSNKEEQEKAEKIFKEINEANDVLSDPQKKQMYDLGGYQKGNTSNGGGQGFTGFHNFTNFEDFGFGGSQFGGKDGSSHIFQMFFGDNSTNNFSFGHPSGMGTRGQGSRQGGTRFSSQMPPGFENFFK